MQNLIDGNGQLVVETLPEVPKARGTGGRRLLFLLGLDRLGVGQSVFVPDTMAAHGAVRTAVYRFARLVARKFRTEKIEGGVRVWRLS